MNASQYRKLMDRQKGECTWCGQPVGPGRRTWCSDACVESFRWEHDRAYLRLKVEQRDGGVCAICGADCSKILRLLKLCRRDRYCRLDSYRDYLYLWDHYAALGFNRNQSFWQADHITPRVLGGGNQLDNLRTLCVPCHKRVTAELAAYRAIVRKEQQCDQTKFQPTSTENLSMSEARRSSSD